MEFIYPNKNKKIKDEIQKIKEKKQQFRYLHKITAKIKKFPNIQLYLPHPIVVTAM